MAIAITITVTTPSFAQYRSSQSECFSQFANKLGYFSNSRTNSGDCIPYPLEVNPEYGAEYSRLMRIAINAGTNNDFNSYLSHSQIYPFRLFTQFKSVSLYRTSNPTLGRFRDCTRYINQPWLNYATRYPFAKSIREFFSQDVITTVNIRID